MPTHRREEFGETGIQWDLGAWCWVLWELSKPTALLENWGDGRKGGRKGYAHSCARGHWKHSTGLSNLSRICLSSYQRNAVVLMGHLGWLLRCFGFIFITIQKAGGNARNWTEIFCYSRYGSRHGKCVLPVWHVFHSNSFFKKVQKVSKDIWNLFMESRDRIMES